MFFANSELEPVAVSLKFVDVNSEVHFKVCVFLGIEVARSVRYRV